MNVVNYDLCQVCIGLYREIAIAIQDEVGDSNEWG